MPSPRAFDSSLAVGTADTNDIRWGRTHMIPPEHARAARMLNRPSTFDKD